MKLQQKSLSKVTLESVLRKKRTNLKNFLAETGITTYDLLVSRCSTIGVVPPEESTFLKIMGNPTTHEYTLPTEGIVVLDPDLDPSLRISDESEKFQELSHDQKETSIDTKKKKKKSDTKAEE
jgi:hypothetical protein